MAFDFFNTSNLAFGAKLTRAFKQLNDLLDAAEEHLTVVYGDLYIYGEYIDRNYLVPVPNRPDAACQTNQAYDIVNDEAVIIKSMKYDEDTGFTINIKRYNRVVNRMTNGTGTTNIKSGYCYLKEALSNNNPDIEVKFSREQNGTLGDLVFKYNISDAGVIQIDIQQDIMLTMKPSGSEHYASITFGKENLKNTIPREITGNEAYIAIQNIEPETWGTFPPEFQVSIEGYTDGWNVSGDNQQCTWKGTSGGSGSYVPFYLRKGDKISHLLNADLYRIYYHVID